MIQIADEDRGRRWARMRAALGLAVLVAALGVAAAALLGMSALALTALLDRALG